MDLVDTHCHLDVSEFDDDRDQIISRCRDKGINRIVIPAIKADSWDSLLSLCHQQSGLFPALGLHPVFVDKHRDEDLDALEQYVSQNELVAVGEIGLDYYIKELDRGRQQVLFDAQLEIAKAVGLPVILHVRKSHDQILSSLKRIKVAGGVCHAFNGSLQQAQQYIELGFKLGFGGTLTYERSQKIRQLAQVLPLEAIVLETDAPDMVVAAHRGERNSPEYLTDCLHALVDVRDESLDVIATQTTQNACNVFHLV